MAGMQLAGRPIALIAQPQTLSDGLTLGASAQQVGLQFGGPPDACFGTGQLCQHQHMRHGRAGGKPRDSRHLTPAEAQLAVRGGHAC